MWILEDWSIGALVVETLPDALKQQISLLSLLLQKFISHFHQSWFVYTPRRPRRSKAQHDIWCDMWSSLSTATRREIYSPTWLHPNIILKVIFKPNNPVKNLFLRLVCSSLITQLPNYRVSLPPLNKSSSFCIAPTLFILMHLSNWFIETKCDPILVFHFPSQAIMLIHFR